MLTEQEGTHTIAETQRVKRRQQNKVRTGHFTLAPLVMFDLLISFDLWSNIVIENDQFLIVEELGYTPVYGIVVNC